MQNDIVKCNRCYKNIHKNIRKIFCAQCNKFYHVKCTDLKSTKVFNQLKAQGKHWLCHICSPPVKQKPTKCKRCKKSIPKNKVIIKCSQCKKYFHSKCSNITYGKFSKCDSWMCNGCTDQNFPFAKLDNNEFGLTMKGVDIPVLGDNTRLVPCFTIQTLLDKIPGDMSIQTLDFLSESTNSKYYTPSDFISAKISDTTFSIFHINIASINAHIDDLNTLIEFLGHPFDIIGITETKILENREPLANIKIIGYDFENTPTESFFGGCGIFIRSDYDYEKRDDLSLSVHTIAESVFVELKSQSNKNILIGCIYRHHTKISLFIQDFLEKIMSSICSEKHKVCAIMGDFNIDLLKVDEDDETCQFFDLMSSNGFRPLILQPTRVTLSSATLIDNIFINDMQTTSTGGNITTSISDHFPQFCSIDIFEKNKKTKSVKYARSYKHFNQNEFENELKSINWDALFQDQNSDGCMKNLLLEVENLLNTMAPVRRLTKKEINIQKLPWITKGILKSMKDRDRNHKEYIKESDVVKRLELFKIYKQKRNLIVSLTRKSKSDYFVSYFEENKANIKKTWEGIRNIVNISKKNRILPSKIIDGNNIISEKNDIAGSLNNFFVNIGNMVENKIPQGKNNFMTYLKDKNANSIILRPVTDNEIVEMVRALITSKSCGPNSIQTHLLKTNLDYFLFPLKKIINLSFSDGIFPDLLKCANVCPIYKKNDKNKCENYRPISLLSNISKLFEKAMHSRIYEFFEESNVFYDLQFGFRKSYSTNHALISIVENIRDQLDNKTFSCGVFIDLEKAFDTVNHSILIQKLDHYGIRGISNEWLKSYLVNRKQNVVFDGVSSEYRDISCGVPQGSILGPLLFLLYINDMHSSVKYSTIHHFADDTNLLYSNKDLKLLRKHMNEDLKLIFDWLCANRLSLNVSKTEFIIFKPPKCNYSERITLNLNNTKIYESKKIKYLGLIMDEKLTWKYHIFELRKKLNRTVGILYKMQKLKCQQKILLSVYYALFHSHLNYGLCVWGHADDQYVEQIKLAQKRAIRVIAGAKFSSPSEPLFKELGILNVDDLFTHQYACLMWDHQNGHLPLCFKNYFQNVSDVHNHYTRRAAKDKLCEIGYNTKHGRTNFKYHGAKIYNSINDFDFFKDPRPKYYFKRQFKKYLLSQ